jgi:hypothetical protein
VEKGYGERQNFMGQGKESEATGKTALIPKTANLPAQTGTIM